MAKNIEFFLMQLLAVHISSFDVCSIDLPIYRLDDLHY